MPAVETFQSWFLSSKCDPAGSVHLPTRKETFAFCGKCCWENTTENYQFRDRSLLSERKLDDDKHHSETTVLSSFYFFFSPFFPPSLFALAGNEHASAWWGVCMRARRRSLSRAELSPHHGHSVVTWSCSLQGRFAIGLTLIFGQGKPSCSHRIKQLKWKATPAVRPLWLLFCCARLE